jgi:RimJ/RimL family protein N-acetyltransferase
MTDSTEIVLTPIEHTDALRLFAWINDRDLVRMHGPFHSVSEAEHQAWMEHAVSDKGRSVLAIRTEPARLIGLIQLVSPHQVHRSIELRIRIGDVSDRGRGFGRQAVEQACRYAFDALGMERVFLHVFEDNRQAIAAYEAAGFLNEGLMRRAALIEGEWKNVVVMGRLRGADPEFTETGFRALLQALKAGGYRFARFGEAASDQHVLWRHDVDLSVQRAARLAAIEAEMGVQATYFLNPRCGGYNLAEASIHSLVKGIIDGGHILGLHFDTGNVAQNRLSFAQVEKAVDGDRRLLETLTGHKVEALSWHNPDMSNVLEFDAEVVAGLPNAYGRCLRSTYEYCSDSNGYWRYRPMGEIIATGRPRLHLLTHPEWWTPAPLTASQRFDRALNGRAAAVRRAQIALLGRGNRTQPDG